MKFAFFTLLEIFFRLTFIDSNDIIKGRKRNLSTLKAIYSYAIICFKAMLFVH